MGNSITNVNVLTKCLKWPSNEKEIQIVKNVNNPHHTIRSVLLHPIKNKLNSNNSTSTMPTGTLARAFFALVFDKVYCASGLGKDNGFGNRYIWASSLESGMQMASHHKKPVMLIIHKSWCSACKRLKPQFASSNEIQALSKKFIMVNLMDDDEPSTVMFAPDGNYIPRILFISPDGSVDREIYNEEGSSQHRYFYSRPEQITKSMKKVLAKYKHEQFDV